MVNFTESFSETSVHPSSKFQDDLQGKLNLLIANYAPQSNDQKTKKFIKTYLVTKLCKSEAIHRLSESLVCHYSAEPACMNDFEGLVMFPLSSTVPTASKLLFDIVSKWTQLLEHFMDKVTAEQFTADQVQLRNVCMLLHLVLDKFGEHFQAHLFMQAVINFLAGIICHCDHLEAIQWALITLDMTNNKINIHQIEFVKLSEYCNSISSLYQASIDYLRYQVGFCADWSLRRLQVSSKKKTLVKLSLDGFIARNDDLDSCPLRSLFSTNSAHKHYFEVVLFTDKQMCIGWSIDLEKSSFVGDDKLSVGFDGFNRLIWHHNRSYQLANGPRWKIGDVVGCLIDSYKREFFFYLNGRSISLKKKPCTKFHFSPQPYFSAITLHKYQQCFVNFGQIPFKFAPEGIEHINSDSLNRLLEPCSVDDDSFWFKQDLLVVGELQNQFDLWIADLECAVDGGNCAKNLFEDLELRLLCLLSDDDGKCWLRLVQSLIKLMGNKVDDDKIDLVIGWIDNFWSDTDGSLFPSQAKILETIYPFLCQTDNSTIERNICFVLSVVMSMYNQKKTKLTLFSDDVIEFLRRSIIDSGDEWTLMFAVICFDYLAIDNKARDQILKDDDILHELANYAVQFDQCKVPSDSDPIFQSHWYQIGFCSRWSLNHLLNSDAPDRSFQFVKQKYKFKLDQLDKTEYLKLSSDGLSARSDHGWQSVRSSCCATSGAFFYEVTIITDGPMIFGWATKEVKLEDSFGRSFDSLGYDGYERTILHGSVEQKLANVPTWKANDVIGCLIDLDKGQFVFYLNGILIDYQMNEVHLHPKSYFAAASICTHQQCFFNFGQIDFKFPPEHVRFNNFYHSM